ncbi:peptidoglycan editing factor PgeF [Geobacillus thermodenitrificans]|uniref:peptidoglycan editing factor PgeF n=1 Tax=Geobacillus thermodenitrificans TaxID=33940 RepID=UPI00040557B2|nr:peptidoglycan editing factor PgeF [Geobacillus thermodenitrificans]ARA97235.1 laccase [Geobacillus thermodenitrificans]
MPDIFQQTAYEWLLCGAPPFAGAVAGITTKQGGESKGSFASLNMGLHVGDDRTAVVNNRRRLAASLVFPLDDWVCCEQVHGAVIQKVTKSDRGSGAQDFATAVRGADGLYTDEAGVLLALCFADCVPVYFMAPSVGLVGLAHAGWRGTAGGIAQNMVRLWQEREHVAPADMYAAIGPAIGPCCYTVDDRVIDGLRSTVPAGSPLPWRETSPGQYALDLKEANRLQLIAAGVPDSHIYVSERCTSCEETLFFSHRRDRGTTGRMLAFIGRREETT